LSPGSVLQVDEFEVENDDIFASSLVLDITLLDPNGEPVQPEGELEVCFTADEDIDTDEACLGTEDDDGQWVCVDCVRTKNDRYCGTTDHLSLYALLDVGGSGQNDACVSGDSSDGYITGIGWGDAVLVVSVTLFVVCICFVVLVVLVKVPKIHGKEYARIANARSSAINSSRVVEREMTL